MRLLSNNHSLRRMGGQGGVFLREEKWYFAWNIPQVRGKGIIQIMAVLLIDLCIGSLRIPVLAVSKVTFGKPIMACLSTSRRGMRACWGPTDHD